MKPFKVALVNSPVLGTIDPWTDEPEFPRPALACLAAFLRRHSSYEILCIDAKFDRLNFEQAAEKILNFGADVVGFTAFTPEIKPSAYLAAKVKERNPNIVTLIGGAHLTALPDRTLLEFPSFDFGIAGDGEESLLEFCQTVEAKGNFSVVNGLIFRSGKEVIINTPRARMLNLDELPMPAWDMFRRANHYWVQTSKGCPFKCHFCMNHNGRVARTTSVQKTIDEINFLIDNYHPEWIRFGDELFSVDMNRTSELLDEMIVQKMGGKFKWDVQTHVKYTNRELFKKFKLANVSQVDMGVESGDSYILKHIGKGTNLEMIAEAFKIAHEEGVPTGSLIVLGQPDETLETVMKSIDIAVKINPKIPMFGIMVPFPGTEIARMAAKGEGGYINLSTNWDEYRKQIGGAVDFAGISRKRVERIQFIGYLKVFVLNYRIWDLAKFIWEYRIEGVNILKKILRPGKDFLDMFDHMPADYETALKSGHKASYDDMIFSREQFDIIQSDELKRTNKLRPDLIKSQMPVKILAQHTVIDIDEQVAS